MSELSAEEIVALSKRYTMYDWQAQSKASPVAVDRAEGVYFWDVDGKRYLDFNSQLMGVNIGHGDRLRLAVERHGDDRLVAGVVADHPGQVAVLVGPGTVGLDAEVALDVDRQPAPGVEVAVTGEDQVLVAGNGLGAPRGWLDLEARAHDEGGPLGELELEPGGAAPEVDQVALVRGRWRWPSDPRRRRPRGVAACR